MSANETSRTEWSKRTPAELAYYLIEDFKFKYAKSYERGSKIFERWYYGTSIAVIVLGILISITAVLTEQDSLPDTLKAVTTTLLVLLPILSSGLVAISIQFGFKEKYSLRETARIEASFYYNVARARYQACKNETDYLDVFKWLTGIMKDLQDQQMRGYMASLKELKKDE